MPCKHERLDVEPNDIAGLVRCGDCKLIVHGKFRPEHVGTALLESIRWGFAFYEKQIAELKARLERAETFDAAAAAYWRHRGR